LFNRNIRHHAAILFTKPPVPVFSYNVVKKTEDRGGEYVKNISHTVNTLQVL
jgi:hypothetical protein